jgi:Zn-dependent protease with chaperone function
MKWIFLFLAIWNVVGALLRMLRTILEKLPLTRKIYPKRDSFSLDEISDLELSAGAKARYRAAVEEVARRVGMPTPELRCSLKSAMLAGTRGWGHHQLHLSRGILTHASDRELLAIVAHELGHIRYRHFALLRIVELLAALAYARVVYGLWGTHFAWYTYLGIWSLLDFSFSLSRLAAGSVTELMADHFAAHKLNLAQELSQGLMRAQCFNGVTEFTQITHFYPTVRLRVRLLSRYARALGPAGLAYR